MCVCVWGGGGVSQLLGGLHWLVGWWVSQFISHSAHKHLTDRLMIKVYKVILTFECVDEILRCRIQINL